MIAFEMQHYMKRKSQGNNGLAALKLDISKAYDRLEWPLLRNIMIRLGFDVRWVNLIMECVSTLSYFVLNKGQEIGPITPQRGLRHGDPISPYLFILVAEGFSAMIRDYESRGKIHGFTVARNAPPISHLFFADDSFIFFKASVEEATNLKQLLKYYEKASGQSINLTKSSLAFSKNTPNPVRDQLSNILGIHHSGNNGNYLGLPMIIGRNKTEILKFIKNRIVSRIQGWNHRFISKAGREILLKSVLQALPSYAMRVFLLPKGLIQEVETTMNSYWWKGGGNNCKGIIWKTWKLYVHQKNGEASASGIFMALIFLF
ncbi:PREDICTED: uncharacterized protein LOC109155332 [Ipomoea nil]|uniref:uncharacterized protein LOC109155332 n=1 Tax=Ipomoea nil TaxID=35883 RepID=UPI0009013A65|nr:PREDICTED: uncharacterized protein LOC109155332 [Ipomoea nil]